MSGIKLNVSLAMEHYAIGNQRTTRGNNIVDGSTNVTLFVSCKEMNLLTNAGVLQNAAIKEQVDTSRKVEIRLKFTVNCEDRFFYSM